MLADKMYPDLRPTDLRTFLAHIIELTCIAIIYVGLAKLSLAKGRLKLSDHVARDHVMYVLLSLTCRAALLAQLEWRILAQARKDVRRRLVEPEAGRIR